jgi:hypothetical protein
MPILSPRAFGASARMVSILPPGTQGTPVQPGISLRATLLPQEAAADGNALPDRFVVVAHVPKPGSSIAEPEWQRVELNQDPQQRVGYEGNTIVDAFHADDVPVDAAVAGQLGIWFTIETPPHVEVTQRPDFLGIHSTPGDLLAWGQSYGNNVKPQG